MTHVRVTTVLRAPIERCFDLARSVDAHLRSAALTGERVVAGRASGLLELGDEVTWEARHLGVLQRLSSRITAFERPSYFQDRMTRGAFASFVQDHHFESLPDGATRIVDVIAFAAPMGPIGWLFKRAILASHLRRFLVTRNASLKQLAERCEPGRHSSIGRPSNER